jgi:hypothetical protein
VATPSRDDLDSFVQLTQTMRLEARLLGFVVRREALYLITMLNLGAVVVLWRAGLFSL